MDENMGHKEMLLGYGKKSIVTEELAELLNVRQSDAEKIYGIIETLKNEGLIEPVKSSGTNGNLRYPLYKKYRILAQREVNEETIKAVNRLHPILLKSGYFASNPERYREFREVIDGLNSFFFSGPNGDYISRKERSYELFGREKVLDDSGVKGLLNKLGISREDLWFYDTPEYCFHDYIPVRKDSMTLLICENKDIWFNIRRYMFEDDWKSLFGVQIDGVVYGEGNRISQKERALSEYVKFMGEPDVHFLYWGDIDREGFDIFKRTKEVNDSLHISLFVPGYQMMLERAKGTSLEDSPSSKKEGISFDGFLTEFTDEEQKYLKIVLEGNKLIPQEIISYTQLKP
ncbi:Wadjet anti-phage system protein JetD domain-containing protein [Oribacterium sp. WCC10]|uniref:Wadjet anti-phage system protein JetD domain-containing protein n=1 Tax=Oribacterium sp. WCC10 TaxID=1855343 RepID=UPI0008E9E297|nr:Wadjet anti-phage system protein JetD domain-containing protein [Oribacterium sp. WCC10]SFG82995.1 hypothetical protein SAMN05216356_1402 [Oribacterium sp. WCC10]